MNAEGTRAFQVGDEVAVASGWKLKTSLASRTMRVGTIVEVLGEGARTRYRIRWSNQGGGESIYRPTGASMRLAAERPDPGFAIS
jgi:hypothetical protein